MHSDADSDNQLRYNGSLDGMVWASTWISQSTWISPANRGIQQARKMFVKQQVLFRHGHWYRIFFKYFTNWSQWSQFSHCFSGWFLKKKRHLLWRIFVSSMTLHLRWLLHHVMILQLPNIYCSVFFWNPTTSSNKNSLSSLGQLTMALFFFKWRIKTSKHMAPSGIYFPYVSNPFPIFSLLPQVLPPKTITRQVSPRWSARTARPLRYRRWLGIFHWTSVN